MLKILNNNLIEVVEKLKEDSLNNCKEFIFSGNEIEKVGSFLNTFNFVCRKWEEYSFNYFSSYRVSCVNEQDIEEYGDNPKFNLYRLSDYDMKETENNMKKTLICLQNIDLILEKSIEIYNLDTNYTKENILNFYDSIYYYEKIDGNELPLNNIICETDNYIISVYHDSYGHDTHEYLIIKEREEESKMYKSYTSWYKEKTIKEELERLTYNFNNNPENDSLILNILEKTAIKKYIHENFNFLYLNEDANLVLKSIQLYTKDNAEDFAVKLKEKRRTTKIKILRGSDIKIAKNTNELPEFNMEKDYLVVNTSWREDPYSDATIYDVHFCLYRGILFYNSSSNK